jgi:hypothetical protein
MTAYRTYCVDGAGHISLAEWIEAPNDSEAIAEARRMNRGALRCEVWQGGRLVATLNQRDLADAPSSSADGSFHEGGAGLAL